MEDIPLPDESVDVAISNGVLAGKPQRAGFADVWVGGHRPFGDRQGPEADVAVAGSGTAGSGSDRARVTRWGLGRSSTTRRNTSGRL